MELHNMRGNACMREGYVAPSAPLPMRPIRRNPSLRRLLTVAWVVPAGSALTLILHPFWSWWEAITGWESVGHSGPAGWCCLATWVALIVLTWFAPVAARSGAI